MAASADVAATGEPLDTKTLLDMPPVSPDLSSLSSSARAWDGAAPQPTLAPMATGGAAGPEAPTGLAAPVALGARGDAPPSELASGSSRRPSPYGDADPSRLRGPRDSFAPPNGAVSGVRVVQAEEAVFGAPTGSFGDDLLARRRRSSRNLYLALAAGLVAVIIAIIVVIATSGSSTPTVAVGSGSGTPVAVADPDTGIKLYIEPRGVTVKRWTLDGEVRTEALPAQIKGLAPGYHQISIDAPDGYLNVSQPVEVARGEVQEVHITLESSGLGSAAPEASTDVVGRFRARRRARW
ncbi:MAG: hypothetical protein R2939_20525 [Kofleriaceae bacterium]